MRELPSGTVTFLFTDIEGSTRLLHELGDAYAEALTEHRRRLRDAFSRHNGVEVDTQGDAFFVAFSRATDALAAAREAREALDGLPIRVRMGVHTGEPLRTDEGYVGLDVHRAARIAAAGHGGQILVSRSTRDLATGEDLRDLGEHRLKDLTAPERIYQLGDGDFPPLKSLNTTNLPVAATPLVGRGRELAEVVGLISETRLVTLTGVGGAGKTRLALQVAAEVIDDFPGGVFFVPLAGVPAPELVRQAVAATVGIREPSELAERRALLVLDNFEHLLDAAPVVTELLAAAPHTRVVATSRAPLRVDGEREYALDPLDDENALALLVARARAVRPAFEPDAATIEICRHLDGLPLALELAAARLRSLDSAALLERLERRLPLLTSGRRDAPERQRTLRATIEWSYNLLDRDLQVRFARLGVFATFSLEAAEQVADADLADVDALVETSLLKPLGADRLLMLETLREFALEQLAASGEENAIRRRHLLFLLDLAERAGLQIEAPGPMRHDLVLADRNNIRAALEWAHGAGEHELGLLLATTLENLWVSAADAVEGTRWIEALLAGAEPGSPLHALALRCLGNCAVVRGDVAEGIDLYRRSAEESRALGDELQIAITLSRVAMNELWRGDVEAALELNAEQLHVFQRLGFGRGEAQCLGLIAIARRRQGRLHEAHELLERAAALCRATGFTWWEQSALLHDTAVLLELGRAEDALRVGAQALAIGRRIDDRLAIIEALALAARGHALAGDTDLAARLWRGIDGEGERRPPPHWTQERQRLLQPLVEAAGPGFAAAVADGRATTLEEAVSDALAAVAAE